MPPAVEARSLNHWTAREVPVYMQFLTSRVDYPLGPFPPCSLAATFLKMSELNKVYRIEISILLLEHLSGGFSENSDF